ncbi:c-type cytochrome [Pseudomonadales bacterium]|jgi:cytochrome c|nr:c-type cytochrome [Pseudomonadales bacterium]|tara:strand:- start:406 stop:810 length:405 start_codon:yes stop_codon:yes gene_type:complete
MKRGVAAITAVQIVAIVALSSRALAACDAEAGKRVYNKCAACHAVEAGVHMMGPSLHGLFGRTVGAVEGFIFSEPMAAAGFVWDRQMFASFIENPMQFLPGTTMPFAGIRKLEQREALGCYLAGIVENEIDATH